MLKKQMKSYIIDMIGTIIGSAIMAFATASFLLPSQLSSGGFSGIATITYYFLKIPVGLMILILNIPLLIDKLVAGFIFKIKIGKRKWSLQRRKI